MWGWKPAVFNDVEMMARICGDGIEVRDFYWWERVLCWLKKHIKQT